MHTDQDTYDTPIRIDESSTIYVTDDTAAHIRGEATAQADRWLREAKALWDDCDVEDIEQVKKVEYKIGRLSDALSALRYLAPLADDGEE